MPRYTVHFTQTTSSSVTVEAEDPEAAVEGALTEGLPGLCAYCTGYSNRDWSREDDGELEPYSVRDAAGNEVLALQEQPYQPYRSTAEGVEDRDDTGDH